MRNPKFASIASVALLGLLSSQAFAWSISGVVQDKATGAPLAGVKISSFNYPGIETVSADGGTFSLSDATSSLSGMAISSMNVQFSGNVLSINNVHANVLKVSMMNALGKVIYQRTVQQVHGTQTFDLSKYTARGVKFARINIDGASSSYLLTNKGALLKEGDPLPSFMFVKDGYKSATYQMVAEVETNVVVQMGQGTEPPPSSSSVASGDQSSSSVEQPKSSSSVEEVVDCSGKTMKAKTTITVDGRKIDVHFPNGYKGDKPVPLLVYYHPIMGSSSNADGSSTVKAALADGAIVAAPNGATGGMGQAWNVGPCCTTADDVTFSRHFIAEIKEKACVDPKRIYAAGFSMGGGFSNYAGCEMADIFAAAAPSAFDLAKEIVDAGKCKPARPYPILNFRGTSDNIVMYDGGLSQVVPGMPITFMGAKNNLKEWAKMNGCKGDPKQGVPGNGCEMYEDCDGGAKVGLCTIQGGQHAEGDGQMGWNFVKQFSL